jgi:type II secretory pathway pseudopilin PulG
MTTKQLILSSLLMALVASAVVWYLQTDSRERLAKQFQLYLERMDQFRAEFPEPPPAT